MLWPQSKRPSRPLACACFVNCSIHLAKIFIFMSRNLLLQSSKQPLLQEKSHCSLLDQKCAWKGLVNRNFNRYTRLNCLMNFLQFWYMPREKSQKDHLLYDFKKVMLRIVCGVSTIQITPFGTKIVQCRKKRTKED